jgi:hypothetical protein
MKKCTYCGKQYPDEAMVCAIDQTELLSDKPVSSAVSGDRQQIVFQEKRPTCVTVISWVWIGIGGFMGFSAIMGLFVSLMFTGNPGHNMPGLVRLSQLFAFVAVIQLGMAVLGIIAGINFLKLKAWARNVLEALTWLVLIYIGGFMVFWLLVCISWSKAAHDSAEFPIVGAVAGAVFGVGVSAIYGVPFAIMLKFLRSDKVKLAIGMEPSEK